MPDLYYNLLNSFGFFLAGQQPDVRPASFKGHFGKIFKSTWVNILFYADLNNKWRTLHFNTAQQMKRIQCSQQMGQKWTVTKRKARVKTLNLLKCLGSYPSNTSFSNGAFWSQTGQIHVVFLHNIKIENQCILTRLLPVIRNKENTTQSGVQWQEYLASSWVVYLYIEDITWMHGEMKFVFEWWNIFQHEKRNFVSLSDHAMFYLSYKHQWNTKPFHFNSFLLWKV